MFVFIPYVHCTDSAGQARNTRRIHAPSITAYWTVCYWQNWYACLERCWLACFMCSVTGKTCKLCRWNVWTNFLPRPTMITSDRTKQRLDCWTGRWNVCYYYVISGRLDCLGFDLSNFDLGLFFHLFVFISVAITNSDTFLLGTSMAREIHVVLIETEVKSNYNLYLLHC